MVVRVENMNRRILKQQKRQHYLMLPIGRVDELHGLTGQYDRQIRSRFSFTEAAFEVTP